QAVLALTGEGFTPLSETLYEALQYFSGGPPLFGTDTENDFQSVPEALDGAKYRSPITLECQKNHIVYLTDGLPTLDLDADSEINARLAQASPNISDTTCDADNGDNCLDELSEFLATQDLASNVPGRQTATVHTVGFLTNQDLLRKSATVGKGSFFFAQSARQLAQVFAAILTRIQGDNATFSGPSVSVNAFNRLTNRKDLYFALFEPSTRQRWPGNVKRYELDCLIDDPLRPGFCADGPDAGSDPDAPIIVDADGQPAVSDITGFFATGSRSFWTPTANGPDGDDTQAGGAAGVLGFQGGSDDPATRVVYTFTGAYTGQNGAHRPAGIANLAASDHRLTYGNSSITDTMIYPNGANAGDPTRDDVLKWTEGIDILDIDNDGSTTDARHQLGDSLHSQPALFDYGSSPVTSDLTLFAINNDGYFHAIDTDTGNEVFSFVPIELLPDMPNLIRDPTSTGQRPYGLDGPITLWHDDRPVYQNGQLLEQPNGRLDVSNGERLIAYFGQRRGGRRYYAVDITNRSAPTLLWKIEGGEGDYSELGQTWSALQKARIQIGTTVRDVVVFAGGYDPTQDFAIAPQDDAQGRAIYIADALTGERIWSAGGPNNTDTPTLTLSEMTNSIPSDVSVFDISGDGLADRIYVGDTRAQVFRIDINNGASSAGSLALGARIAALQMTSSNATPGPSDNRRFYHQPDVAFAVPEDEPAFLAITLGSGYRAHPLNDVIEDRFYMLRDPNIGNITSDSAYANSFGSSGLDESDLTDVTILANASTSAIPPTAAGGWLLKLGEIENGNVVFNGEKALAAATTFQNKVLFTTFTPPTTALTQDCLPNQGQGRLYAVNLFDGSPVENLDESTPGPQLTETDRRVALLRPGIPPRVTILFSPLNGVTPVGVVATETIPIQFRVRPVKTYWYQQSAY
ncbi:MAG: hypothetical protein AAF493_28005, partial [Pseudomonadota bacterium]